MQDLAWPFLVSRNRSHGYQTVVSPGFLIDAKAAGLLATKVQGEPSDAGSGPKICTRLVESPAGPVTLVYRANKARLNGQALRDRAGRPVIRFGGVVLRGLRDPDEVGDDLLASAEGAVEDGFRQFWDAANGTAPVRSSGFPVYEAVPATAPVRETPAAAPMPAPAVAAQESRRLVIGGAIALSFFAGVLVGGLLVAAPDGLPTAQAVAEEPTAAENPPPATQPEVQTEPAEASSP